MIDLPSFIWCGFLSSGEKHNTSYYSFYPEALVNRLGESINNACCSLTFDKIFTFKSFIDYNLNIGRNDT